MIFNYGFTKIGFYHLEKNIVCQDYHLIKQIDKRFCIATVADGLGSETHTDIASKLACETVIDFLSANITRKTDINNYLQILKNSFNEALKKIEEFAKANSIDIDQMDTTLSAVIFIDGDVFFGNSGDSGVLVLNSDGAYEQISEKQIDENGLVYPLCFGPEKWQFGFKDNVASVLLATDGIFNTLFPYLLNDQEIKIYVPLCEYLMNNNSLNFNKRNIYSVKNKIENFLDSITKEEVNDDKTLVVLFDDSVKVKRQPDEYYQMPDRDKLKKIREEKYFREAYPNLNLENSDLNKDSEEKSDENSNKHE